MLRCMRTTITLDKDVAAIITRLRKTKNLSLRQIINDSLREGLKRSLGPPPRRSAFRTRSVDLGRCLIGNIDDVAEALAVGEGESYR